MATTKALVTRLMSRYNDPNEAILTKANWLDHLNDAYRWVQQQAGPAQWPFMESQNLNFVYKHGWPSVNTLPIDAGTLNVVFDVTDGYILEAFPTRQEAFIQFPTLTDVGSAAYYRLRGNVIELWPVPQTDVTLLLEFSGGLPLLAVDGTSDPLIDDRHITVLLEYALYLAYQDDDDEQTSQVHKQEALSMVQAMKADLLVGRTTRNSVIVDEWW
jgi:hypothetical protein